MAAVSFCSTFVAFAQSTVSGTVYDTNKPTPLTGAAVVINGTNTASITDLDGKYTIKAKEGDVLVVQFIGYKEQRVTVGKAAVIDFVMKPETQQLNEVMETLSPRECKVIRLRFGLEDGRAHTLEEVGKEFDVTRERVRQIEAKALRKLRHPSRSKILKDFLN